MSSDNCKTGLSYSLKDQYYGEYEMHWNIVSYLMIAGIENIKIIFCHITYRWSNSARCLQSMMEENYRCFPEMSCLAQRSGYKPTNYQLQ